MEGVVLATYVSEKRLFRMRDGAYVGGVCAGIAEYFEVDTIVVRILAVMLTPLTLGAICIVYAIMWARVPLVPESAALYDVRPESAESTSFGNVEYEPFSPNAEGASVSLVARLAVAAGLMVLFLIVAMGLSPFVPGAHWWQFWPICLVMLGLCLVIIPIRTRHETLWHAVGIVLTSVAASMVPMSLGIVSWNTVALAGEQMWPLVALAIALLLVGLYRENDALLLLSAFCVVAFCLMGIAFFAIPGEIESLLLNMPSGDSVRIVFVR